jgi:hypothetical protein
MSINMMGQCILTLDRKMMTLLGVMQPAMPCISFVDVPFKVHDLVTVLK